ncbi:ribonuclease J1 [Bacillus luti]|nr:ribonuclease J1 [Bacillus cereus]
MKHKHSVRIIPLGGLGEIGKNMTVVEYRDNIYIIDVGMAFPDEHLHGVDYVLPNFDYLRTNKHKIKKLLITHAHEDHIGGLVDFLKEFDVNLYTTKLTAEIIKTKLKIPAKRIVIVDETTVIKDRYCNVSFFVTNHSIPDSVGVVIETPIGQIVHTGDFKMDYTPSDERYVDFQRLGEIGGKGVLALLSDSTNAEKKGVSTSEKNVKDNLRRYIKEHDGRIIVTSFASSLYRIPSLFELAKETGRRIAVFGRSMENNIKIAKKLGFITGYDDVWVEETEEVEDWDSKDWIILTTGAQGEYSGGISRMAFGKHPTIKINVGDMVMFSSSPIPGNEKSVGKVFNQLLKLGAKVVNDPLIHTTGHGFQEEQKLMLSVLRPKFFVPVHGEYRMLLAHRNTAIDIGISEENILLCENGEVIEVFEDSIQKVGKVESNAMYMDYSGFGKVDYFTLKERKRMAVHGVAVIHIEIPHEKKGEKVERKRADVFVVLKGIVAKHDKQSLHDNIRRIVDKHVQEVESIRQLKEAIAEEVEECIYQHIKRKPVIIPIIS